MYTDVYVERDRQRQTGRERARKSNGRSLSSLTKKDSDTGVARVRRALGVSPRAQTPCKQASEKEQEADDRLNQTRFCTRACVCVSVSVSAHLCLRMFVLLHSSSKSSKSTPTTVQQAA